MNNIENTKNLENNQEKPVLCIKCCEFFGNPGTENMCSKCYKSVKQPSGKTDTILSKKLEQLFEKKEEKKEVEKIDEKKVEEPLANDQQDHSKCYSCSKKVGYLGYKCKCNYTYCKLHRMPEEHKCTFDFQIRAKENLIKANPVVKAEKMEKI